MRNINNTVLSRWFREVWNESNRNSIDELLAEDVIAYGLAPDDQLKGIEAFKLYYDDFSKQFKDVDVTVKDVISEDDIECALCAVIATHIESGKIVKFYLCMGKIKDGKIAEAWNNFDFQNMYQQLGYVLTLQ